MKNIKDIKNIIFWLFMIILSNTETKRPDFRKDYRYDKALHAFYKLHHTPVSWHHARIRCEAEGASLIVPRTLDEADSMMVLISPILSRFDGVYIGIHDLYSERVFVTIRGSNIHSTLVDLLWELQQPLYGGGRCVAMRRNGRLFVHNCSLPLPFACRKIADHIDYNKECDSFDKRWKMGPNSTCYLIQGEKQNWHEAYAFCFAAGGHLAIPDTREETDYIRSLFKEIDPHKISRDFAFLGFSDLFQRYHYRTVLGDALSSIHSNWQNKCPGTAGDQPEDRCGGIRRNGILATDNCDHPAVFFCEKKIK